MLGCTHYPFIAQQVKDVLGDVRLYDGALGTARQLERRLRERGLQTRSREVGRVEFLSSEDTPEELALYKYLFER